MEVREYDADDTASVLAGMEILNACRKAETPWLAPLTGFRRTMQVRHSWDDTPDQHFLGLVDGEPVAVAQLEIGEYDNRDFAWVHLFVHPDHRRRGHATTLLADQAERGLARGCTKIGGAGWELPATRPFAEALGFSLGATEVARFQYPKELPSGLAEEAYAEAAPFASDYELVRLTGYTPDDLLPEMVTLAETINDAPVDDLEVEDEVFTPERVRAYEASTIESGHRLFRLVARHRATGELAGHSSVAVDAERPHLAHQHDTAVRRDHRGHRLGLLLKADMMRWLAEVEPQVESLDTWNAESNSHMVAVNERLGYRVVGRELEFQKRL